MLADGHPCRTASSATSSIGGFFPRRIAEAGRAFHLDDHRINRAVLMVRRAKVAQVEVGFSGRPFCQCLGNAGLAADQRRPAGRRVSKRPSTRFSDNTRQARCGSVNPFGDPAIEPPGRPEPRERVG